MDDNQRAALIAFIQSIFPVAILLGIVSLTADEISIIMLMVTNGITTFFLFWKRGQERGPPA